jgi:hypothetical protein
MIRMQLGQTLADAHTSEGPTRLPCTYIAYVGQITVYLHCICRPVLMIHSHQEPVSGQACNPPDPH